MNTRTEFSPAEIEASSPAEKIGLVATVNPEGLPHMTLLTSLQALDSTHMAFGEFSWGLSKYHVRKNPKTGFLIMTLDRKLFRGKALWTGARKEGEEYEMFNRKPMFRYNTYFGINTVHYLDLVETTGSQNLSLGSILIASLLSGVAKGGAAVRRDETPLTPLACSYFNSLNSLKFLSYLGADGFPVIIPILQCRAAGSSRLAFSTLAYNAELSEITAGSPVAVFAMTMQMESVLIRGTYCRRRVRGISTAAIDIDWVYNSMPPVHGQVYPQNQLEPVTSF